MPFPQPDAFNYFVQKFFGCAFVKPDSEIWLIQADVAIRHETEVGEQIGGVVAIGIQASHHQVLAGRIACVYFRGTLAVHPQDLTELQKEKIRQFLSVFEGDCSIPQILFQIRVTILIKSAWCNGKTVGFDLRNHLHQPDCLNSFLERRGGLAGTRSNTAAMVNNSCRRVGSCSAWAFSLASAAYRWARASIP